MTTKRIKELRSGIVMIAEQVVEKGRCQGVRLDYDMKATGALMREAADEIEHLQRWRYVAERLAAFTRDVNKGCSDDERDELLAEFDALKEASKTTQ